MAVFKHDCLSHSIVVVAATVVAAAVVVVARMWNELQDSVSESRNS